MDKYKVAAVLRDIGLLLELKGENAFKTRAYENGARIIESLDEDLHKIIKEKRLRDIPGIGKALSEKIEELVIAGSLKYYEDLRAEFPDGIFELFRVPGLGAKKVAALYKELGISSLGELEYACLENRLVSLPGFGAKTQENILKGIASLKKNADRYLLNEADIMAAHFLQSLKGCPFIEVLSIAGSLRRRKETIKDIDILAASSKPSDVMKYIVSLPDIAEVAGSGLTKTSVRLKAGIAVDIRVVTKAEFPYALHHFTGSREHNTKMRHIAKSLGIKMNEYGLFLGEEESLIKCKNESEIFQALGMRYIPPELREDMGEIEASINGSLPVLVEDEDIRGVFHVHTVYSDGSNTIRELAYEAKKMGYSYMCVSDHSRFASYAHGLSIEQVIKQHEEIDKINKEFDDFHIFKGIESDILQDGGLDYPDEVLRTFDFVIASVHSRFKMDKDKMTKRILRAMENPYTKIIGHLTGRLLLSRDGYELDMDAVIKKAAETKVVIEINANPHRLDMDWRLIKKARENGVKFAISPDAHSASEFYNIGYGVSVARKGWLEKDDIINCLTASELVSTFQLS